MITVQQVQSLTAPGRGRTHRQIEPADGLLVGDVLPPDWDPLQARAILDGAVVELTHGLEDGDLLVIVRTPGLSYLINALIAVAVSLLFPPNIPDIEPTRQGSKTYGISGIGNRWGQSTRVPIVFGKHRASGHVIGYYTETLGAQTGQHVFLLLAISEGEIHEVAGRQVGTTQPVSPNTDVLFIEDNDAARYAGVEITVGMGLDTGTTHAGFMGRYIQRSVGQELGLAFTKLELPYSIGQAVVTVEDNSPFVAGDTILLSYSNTTFSGDAAIVQTVDIDGKRLHLAAPLPSNNHNTNAAVVAFRAVEITGDGTTGKAVRFNINCPSGLYYLDVNSGTQPWTVKVLIEAKLSSGSVWSSLGNITMTNDAVGSFWQTFSFELSSAGLADADVDFRLTKKTRPPTNDATIGDQVDLHSVVLVDEGIYSFPGTAVLGMHGVPNAQLNGRLPEVSAIAKGVKFNKPDNDAGSSFSAATLANDEYRNPAWIALEILRNIDWGAGQYIADADIDFASFREWAEFCEEVVLSGFAQSRQVDDTVATATQLRVPLGAGGSFSTGDEIVIGYGTIQQEVGEVLSVTTGVIGNGLGVTPFDEDFDTLVLDAPMANPHAYGDILGVLEARCLCDLVVDKDTTLWDAIAKVAQSGRCIIVKTGNTYRAVVDKPREPAQMFAEGNINKGSWQHEVTGRVDLPNVVAAVFLNEAENYERDDAPAYDNDAIDSGEIQRVEQIDLFGITRKGQAFRDTAFYLKKKRLLRERASFDVGLDALASEAGDRILVQHRALTRGHGTKIINARQAGSPLRTEVILDDTVELDPIAPAAQFALKVSNPADDTIATTPLLNPGAARGSWVKLGEDIGGAELIGRLCAYGPEETFTTDLVIERIETTEDLQRHLVCTKYDARVYEDNVAGEPPLPPGGPPVNEVETQWEPGTTINEWNGTTAVAHTDDYGSGESQLTAIPVTVQGPDGTPKIAVALSWNPASIAHDYGEDTLPQDFRTGGTWNPVTRTLAGDGVPSDFATEGGGRRRGAPLLGRFAIYYRRSSDTAVSDAWRLAGTWTDRHTAQVQADFDRGETYEFTVIPAGALSAALSPEDGPIVTVAIPLGIDSADQIRLGTPAAPVVVYREQAHQPPVINISWPDASADAQPGLLPDFFEVRLGNGWLTGRPVGRSRGGPFLLSDLTPGADETVFVRSRLKGGQWSADAAVIATSYEGPAFWDANIDQTEAPTWGGSLLNFVLSSGVLLPDASATVHTYSTDTIDAGALGANDRRVLWIAPMISITEDDLDWALDDALELPPNPQAGFDEPIGRRRTAEGDLYDDDVLEIALFYRTSADDVTYSDWIRADGPVAVSARYHQVRVEVTREDNTHLFQIDELFTVIRDATGGGK